MKEMLSRNVVGNAIKVYHGSCVISVFKPLSHNLIWDIKRNSLFVWAWIYNLELQKDYYLVKLCVLGVADLQCKS